MWYVDILRAAERSLKGPDGMEREGYRKIRCLCQYFRSSFEEATTSDLVAGEEDIPIFFLLLQ